TRCSRPPSAPATPTEPGASWSSASPGAPTTCGGAGRRDLDAGAPAPARMVVSVVSLPAVAVMARVPGVEPGKPRLHDALTPARATELYRCFLLDRLDALSTVPDITRVVAFTPPGARARMAALAPAGLRLVAQEGPDLTERLTRLFARLLADG